jgi:hypothetical protein
MAVVVCNLYILRGKFVLLNNVRRQFSAGSFSFGVGNNAYEYAQLGSEQPLSTNTIHIQQATNAWQFSSVACGQVAPAA